MARAATASLLQRRIDRTWRLFCAGLLALGLAACGEEAEEAPDKPVAEVEIETAEPAPGVLALDALPGWQDDTLQEALPAMLRSCARLLRGADDRVLGPDALAGSVADWREPCARFAAIAELPESARASALRAYLDEAFVARTVEGPDGPQGKITGYYEPLLRGARAPDETFRWPLYGRPDDLVRARLGRFDKELAGKTVMGRVGEGGELLPYFSRAEIDGGALAGRGLEIFWLDDPVALFLLHIQGSGRVRLPDGDTVGVGFAASNGLAYTGIGRVMIDEGLIEPGQGSIQGLRAWLHENPEKGREIMQRNARYIFFADTGSGGPYGAQGVTLTDGRSLAVDTKYLPLGVPLWLDTYWPASERSLQRLVVAQDKGAAIKGQVRGDLYWGTGEAALEQAGRMNEPGRYYILLPKQVAERTKPTS